MTATAATATGDAPAVPEKYRALVARLDAVRPGCAHTVRLGIDRDGDRYDLAFLQEFVARVERQHTAQADRAPVEPEPYTRAHLAGDLRASFRRSYDLLPVLEQHEGGRYADDVLDLVPRLIARLAAWGYHPGDVRLSTPPVEGEQPPSDYVKAVTNLVASSARLAKDVRDYNRAADAHARPLRVTRSTAQFRDARRGARRLLDGQSYAAPRIAPPTVGDRRSWWAVTQPAEDGQRYRLERGRMLRAYAQADDVLGPFASKRAADQAGRRATATPDDMRIGLFAALPGDQLFCP